MKERQKIVDYLHDIEQYSTRSKAAIETTYNNYFALVSPPQNNMKYAKTMTEIALDYSAELTAAIRCIIDILEMEESKNERVS